MKTLTVFFFILLLTGSALGQDTLSYQTQQEIFKDLEWAKVRRIQQLLNEVGWAAPIPEEQRVKHSAFFASYNSRHRVPNYVVHVIPKDILYGNQTRTNDFRPDPQIKTGMSDSTDYWMSGWDRGHMAASADFKWSKKALSESYYYSNMVPQNRELNQGAWNKLEMKVREWAIQSDEVIVVTGPVLHDSLPKLPQGSQQVSIPDYLYKIVLDYYPPVYKAIGFIYANRDQALKLHEHVVTIDSLESITGIDFFPALPDSLESQLESLASLKDWDSTYFAPVDSTSALKDFGKGKINAYQAAQYIGKDACVCGKVVSTKYVENGKSNPTYLNLEKKYPEQVFTVIVYGSDRANFSYEPEKHLKDKTICVKGKVGEFKGIPQIIADKEKQIEILPQ